MSRPKLFDPLIGTTRRHIAHGLEADEDGEKQYDSDEALHSSGDEVDTSALPQGTRVSSVHFLLGEKEPEETTQLVGSLNHSAHLQDAQKDQPKYCCGCIKQNVAYGLLALVLILALALFINIHYHVGPDSTQLLSYLRQKYGGGGGGGDDSSNKLIQDLRASFKKASPLDEEPDLFSSDTLRKQRLAQRMQLRSIEGGLSDLPSLGPLEHILHAEPSPIEGVPSPLDSSIEHSIYQPHPSGRIIPPSREQLLDEMNHLAHALNQMHVGAEQPRDGVDSLHLLPTLEDMKDVPLTPDREVQELEAELTRDTDEAVEERLQKERLRLAALRAREEQLAKNKAVREHAAELREEVVQVQAKADEIANEVEKQEAEQTAALKQVQQLERLKKQTIGDATPTVTPTDDASESEEGGETEEDPSAPEQSKDEDDAQAPLPPSEPSEGRRLGNYALDAERAHAEATKSLVEHNSTHVEHEEQVDHPPALELIPPSPAPPVTPKPVVKFNFADRTLVPHLQPVPAKHSFEYCRSCSNHCEHVVNALSFHSSTLIEVDRKKKYSSLSETLARFHRGTAHLFWLNFMHPTPKQLEVSKFTNKAVTTILDGDLHLANFGVFDQAKYDEESGQIYSVGLARFDINDFDQTFIGESYFMDLTRSMVSMIIGMNEMKTKSPFTKDDQNQVLQQYLDSYHSTVGSFVGNDNELTFEITAESAADTSIGRLLHKQTRKKNRSKMLNKYAPFVGHTRQFDVTRKKFHTIDHADETEIRSAWSRYLKSLGSVHRSRMERDSSKQSALHASRFHSAWNGPTSPSLTDDVPPAILDFYHIKSMAQRVQAGLSSLGVKRFWILIEGPSSEPDDDIIIDMKQEMTPGQGLSLITARTGEGFKSAESSSCTNSHRCAFLFLALLVSLEWFHYVSPSTSTSLFASNSIRVAIGASSYLNDADPHLGYLELASGSFVLRARSPFKKEFDLSSLTNLHEWTSFVIDIGRLTAANHARSDNDFDSRLVSTSFEDGFIAAVPDSQKSTWSNSLIDYVWEQYDQYQLDYGCWLNHRNEPAKSAETMTTEDEDEGDDDD